MKQQQMEAESQRFNYGIDLKRKRTNTKKSLAKPRVDDYAIAETRDGSHGVEAEPKPRR